MGMLADRVDHVIGIDTDRDSHSVAVCAPSGAVTAEATVAADARSGTGGCFASRVSRHRLAASGRSKGRAASAPG